jgi:hypothetical protein
MLNAHKVEVVALAMQDLLKAINQTTLVHEIGNAPSVARLITRLTIATRNMVFLPIMGKDLLLTTLLSNYLRRGKMLMTLGVLGAMEMNPTASLKSNTHN